MYPTTEPDPQNPYGISKVRMEQMGREYAAQHELEIVCIRFGGVNPRNRPPEDSWEKTHWFSHEDLLDLFNTILSSPTVPHRFTVMYAISPNSESYLNTKNPWNWIPKDNPDIFPRR